MPKTTLQSKPEVSRNGASHLSLADRAYYSILDQMLRGGLPVGSVLSRRSLAQQLHMSLVPVAEALQRLELEGLVESRPRAGTRVKAPNRDEIQERFELRQALECQAARLCAERSTFQERLQLKRFALNVDALYAKLNAQEVDDASVYAVNEYHADLHMKIAEYARSGLLKSAIEKSRVLIFNWLYDTTAGRRHLPSNFHRDLIGAIVEGDPQQAEDEMRRHVIYGLDTIQLALVPLRQESWRLKR
jgi:DNA-binding GntR family transcriptional regulator